VSIAIDVASSNGSSILIAHLKWGLMTRFGTVVRVLAYQPCGPGSIPARCHMLAPRDFLLLLPFSTFPISNSIRIEDHSHETRIGLMMLLL